jgi:hypothetical protein
MDFRKSELISPAGTPAAKAYLLQGKLPESGASSKRLNIISSVSETPTLKTSARISLAHLQLH